MEETGLIYESFLVLHACNINKQYMHIYERTRSVVLVPMLATLVVLMIITTVCVYCCCWVRFSILFALRGFIARIAMQVHIILTTTWGG